MKENYEKEEDYYADYLFKEITSLGFDVEIDDLIIENDYMDIKIGIYPGFKSVFSGHIDEVIDDIFENVYRILEQNINKCRICGEKFIPNQLLLGNFTCKCGTKIGLAYKKSNLTKFLLDSYQNLIPISNHKNLLKYFTFDSIFKNVKAKYVLKELIYYIKPNIKFNSTIKYEIKKLDRFVNLLPIRMEKVKSCINFIQNTIFKLDGSKSCIFNCELCDRLNREYEFWGIMNDGPIYYHIRDFHSHDDKFDEKDQIIILAEYLELGRLTINFDKFGDYEFEVEEWTDEEIEVTNREDLEEYMVYCKICDKGIEGEWDVFNHSLKHYKRRYTSDIISDLIKIHELEIDEEILDFIEIIRKNNDLGDEELEDEELEDEELEDEELEDEELEDEELIKIINKYSKRDFMILKCFYQEIINSEKKIIQNYKNEF